MADETTPDVPHESRQAFEAMIEEARTLVAMEPHRLKEHAASLAEKLRAL